eukprot:3733799-Amphidinium_carterae.1
MPRSQHVGGQKGDRSDWGYRYLSANQSENSWTAMAAATVARTAFMQGKYFQTLQDDQGNPCTGANHCDQSSETSASFRFVHERGFNLFLATKHSR